MSSAGSARARLWLAGFMGFASGLPFVLTGALLQAWLTEGQTSLATIGMFGLVGLPYTFKFVWAPLVDRFNPLGLGRRRSWLALTQAAIALSTVLLALQRPDSHLVGVALAAWLIAVFSATQDTVIDAYRREIAAREEQAAAATSSIYGYRLGTWLGSAGGLIAASTLGFHNVYFLLAAIMLGALIVTLRAPEPLIHPQAPRTLRAAFVEPTSEFLRRHATMGQAGAVLLFVGLYQAGLQLSGHMQIPFLLSLGFSTAELGTIQTFFGLGPYLLGAFASAMLVRRAGILRVLACASAVVSMSIASNLLLVSVGARVEWLAVVVSFQNLAAGMASAALVAYVSTLTDPRYTATQFAILTALATLPRSTLSAATGWAASQVGWELFFVACAVMALAGMSMVLSFGRYLEASAGAAIASK
jgi:PAT family beta-lactamase induction signal transducer AmpG